MQMLYFIFIFFISALNYGHEVWLLTKKIMPGLRTRKKIFHVIKRLVDVVWVSSGGEVMLDKNQ